MIVNEQGLKLLALARDGGDAHFNPETNLCLISRDTIWYAAGLLFDDSADRRSLGNRLLESAASEDGTHTPSTILALLHSIPQLIASSAVPCLTEQVRTELVHAAETEWRDGNVNHPLGAYCALILGGEMCGETWAIDLGTRRLRRMLQRTGEHRSTHLRQAETSEYNSLTYTALTLTFLALIAEYSRTKEARELALRLEHGFWIDCAMHFHAPSQQFAGPHSRSYHEDSVGGFSAMHGVFLVAGVAPLFINPELPVRFNHPSDLLQGALTAVTPFHLPDRARDIALHKPFPYLFRKTTYGESYHENSRRKEGFAFDEEVYPGGWADLTTYQTGEYALGSASRPYVNAGHADAVMLRVRRADSIDTMADFRSMYSRGIYNGAMPGQKNHCHVTSTEIDESYAYEEGRTLTYQHENVLIALYTPKRAGHLGVSGFRTDICFTYYAPFDEILVSDGILRPVEPPESIPASSRMFIRDHDTFICIQPLSPFPAQGPLPVLLHQCGEFLLISMINYDGPVKDFSREEIGEWRTGFVLFLETKQESGGWEQFVDRAGKAVIHEESKGRGLRTVSLTYGGHTMEFAADTVRESILHRTWDGVDEPVTCFEVYAKGDERYRPPTLFGHEGAGS